MPQIKDIKSATASTNESLRAGHLDQNMASRIDEKDPPPPFSEHPAIDPAFLSNLALMNHLRVQILGRLACLFIPAVLNAF